MMRLSTKLLLQLPLVFAIFTRRVDGTFTIAAADNSTQQVGGAGSSCIEEAGLSPFDTFYSSVPGKSVLLAQGYYLERNGILSTANDLMANDSLPEIVLEAIATPAVDPFVLAFDESTSFPARTIRQYGLADVAGNPASYTGSELETVYELLGFAPSSQTDQQGTFGSFSFAAQGNVVSEPTVSILASTFQENNDACDLAERLMNSITAVHAAGEGDTRCTNGVGSVAFLHVDAADGQEVVHIDITFQDAGGFDPFIPLKESFEEWRKLNPCPEVDVGGVGTTDSTTTQPIEGDPTDAPSSTAYVSCLYFPLTATMVILWLTSSVWFW